MERQQPKQNNNKIEQKSQKKMKKKKIRMTFMYCSFAQDDDNITDDSGKDFNQILHYAAVATAMHRNYRSVHILIDTFFVFVCRMKIRIHYTS